MQAPKKARTLLLAEVSTHPRDLVAFVAGALPLSRTTVHRHLNRLLAEGEILKVGKRSGVRYFLKSARNKTIRLAITPELNEYDVFRQYFLEQIKMLSANVQEICEYGFTEMLNNAVDHSNGTTVWIRSNWTPTVVELEIKDNGIGIFKKLKNAFHYDDIRDCILELSKGKVTTDPENHTGEGVFFTSRAFDRFTIDANGIRFIKDNKEDDYYIANSESSEVGSRVTMRIGLDAKRELVEIFRQFQDNDDDVLPFSKTEIWIKLVKLDETRLVSRSQAKRILVGLDRFKTIALDFDGITAVGQGFVDEIFRIFKQKYPKIQIDYRNANDNIVFMIKRGTH